MRQVEQADTRCRNNDTVHAAFLKGPDHIQLPLRISMGTSQENRVALLVGNFFDAIDHTCHKRIGDISCHTSQGHRPAHHQAAPDQAGAIALLFCNLANAPRCFRVYDGARAKCAGNGRMRNSDETREVFDRNGSGHLFPLSCSQPGDWA